MDRSSNVTVHESAYPETTRQRIFEKLTRGEVDPALLYGGFAQTGRWIALHHAHSPAKSDPNIAALYDGAFRYSADHCRGNVVHVVGLGCGDGTKDARCLELLRTGKRAVIYSPVDVSVEMVLTAENTATTILPGVQTSPLVCDLAACTTLPALLKAFDPSGAERILLFLGTLHNYWPPEILRSLLYPLRSQDHLLLGANLAPAENYEEAIEEIVPQYDNDLTRRWLMGAMAELNVSAEDGVLTFSIQSAEKLPTLKRIQADFVFKKEREVQFFGETVKFRSEQKLRVFYSYRFTPGQIHDFLGQSRLRLSKEWIAPSGEEGLFLCQRAA